MTPARDTMLCSVFVSRWFRSANLSDTVMFAKAIYEKKYVRGGASSVAKNRVKFACATPTSW